jgi:hypothetical protein
MMRQVLRCVCVISILCLPAAAQVGTQATLTGTVVDRSGALILNAKITAVQNSTHFTRTAVTNSIGEFEIDALPVGQYTVTASAPGMKTWKASGVDLTIGARLRLSPQLAVGETSQTVTVTAHDLIETENSAITTDVDMPAMKDFPVGTRNPLGAIQFVPGMFYDGSQGPEQGVQVHGMGLRQDTTTFSLDGVSANAPMDDGAIAIPAIDDIEAMSVETADSSANTGHDPIQVKLVTRSGANAYHGGVWEFFQNDALNAIQRFAIAKPRVRYNQFGGNLGGPIRRDHSFFFASFQGTIQPSETIFNEFAPLAKRTQGDFSGYGYPIIDPTTGLQFDGNIIPPDRINPASKFLAQFLPVANTIGGPYGSLFRALAPNSYKNYESTLRLDQNITSKQKIYVRGESILNRQESPAYLPTVTYNNDLDQLALGANYNYAITPHILLTVTGGYTHTANWFSSPQVGQTNYAMQAGIQGIPTQGAQCCIGFPDIGIGSGYPGIGMPFGVNGKLFGDMKSVTADVNVVKGRHSLGVGYSLQDPAVFGKHGSSSPRGQFSFYNLYSGDGMADFLLGYASSSQKNLPLNTFGLDRDLQSAVHAEDSWRVTNRLTLNLGARYEFWGVPSFVAGNAATFDPAIGKVIAGADSNGQVNLTEQPSAAFVATATANLWEPASEVGIKHMIPSQAHFEPRIGFAWQPFRNDAKIVMRGAYGVYENVITGNTPASDIGAIPFFSLQSTALSLSQLQDYRTLWPADPTDFVQPAVNYTTSPQLNAAQTQAWSVVNEVAMPLHSAFSLAYIGNKSMGQPYAHSYNQPPPGQYANLEASSPFPAFGSINIVENGVDSWYHALQMTWIRNTYHGLYFNLGYTFSRSMSNHAGATGELSQITPYAPAWYERGVSPINQRHVLNALLVYDLPIGKGRQFFSGMNWLLDAFVGGWETSAYYSYRTGLPLSIIAPGASLGNGWGTRADQVGNPFSSYAPPVLYPGGKQYFNPAAFAAPPLYTFGNSPIGAVYSPSATFSNLSILKNFYMGDHSRYVQIGAEGYNFANITEYNGPDTGVGDAYFGQILSAAGARTVTLRAKIIF